MSGSASQDKTKVLLRSLIFLTNQVPIAGWTVRVFKSQALTGLEPGRESTCSTVPSITIRLKASRCVQKLFIIDSSDEYIQL